MTSSSKQLIELARELVVRGGAVDERVDSLILRGTFASADEQVRWLELRDEPPAPFRSVQVYDVQIMGDLDAAEAFDSDRVVQLTIVKPCIERVAAFVFSSGAVSHLSAYGPAALVLSAELEPRAAFQARGLDVVPWILEEAIEEPSRSLTINPRRLVRDYVPGREIVEDLSPWIISSAPAVESAEFLAWRSQSARRLLGGLVTSAVEERGTIWLQASGPPLFRIRIDEDAIPLAWEVITRCAEWVFLSGSDVEARHLIFALEVARANRFNLPLATVLDHALEAAKTTYEAHIQSASRETLKALADLRKTVVDETQRVTQRAQDLTVGLWRDVAVSAAPFVVKVLGDSTKLPDRDLSGWFYFAAAAFITISYALQWRINSVFLEDQKKARARWFDALYAHISSAERTDIAEEPISKAVASYRETRCFVGIVYLALVILLVAFGSLSLLEQPKPPAASPALPNQTSSNPLTTRPSSASPSPAMQDPAKSAPMTSPP